MMRSRCQLWSIAAPALALSLLVATTAASVAQQPAAAPGASPPANNSWSTSVPLRTTIPDAAPKANTTVVPKAASTAPPAAAPASTPLPAGVGQITLSALLTDDGQRIDNGVIWRLYLEKGTPDGRPKFVVESRAASPTVRVPPGDYLINCAFGRATATRRISIKAGETPPEKFVLNAGGLRLAALVGNGEPAPPSTVSFEILADERDQFGNRTRIVEGVRPGIILRLNSGIYHVVSTYGDANAQVGTDVTVEAGKLTEATVAHAVGKASFKLVMRAGGEALADTQWTIATPQGDTVKESVGALPSHMLAPGNYVVSARSQGRTFKREFTLQHNDAVQVEVLVQ